MNLSTSILSSSRLAAAIIVIGLVTPALVGCSADAGGSTAVDVKVDPTASEAKPDQMVVNMQTGYCSATQYVYYLDSINGPAGLPGSPAACGQALYNAGCNSPAGAHSAVPALGSILVTKCAAGTLAQVQSNKFWGNGQFAKYQGYVWNYYQGSWGWAWFDGFDYSAGALWQQSSTGWDWVGYTGSSTWSGWAYSDACTGVAQAWTSNTMTGVWAAGASTSSTSPPAGAYNVTEATYCASNHSLVTIGTTATDEIIEFDPTCGGSCM
jgi:hypothetical protein